MIKSENTDCQPGIEPEASLIRVIYEKLRYRGCMHEVILKPAILPSNSYSNKKELRSPLSQSSASIFIT